MGENLCVILEGLEGFRSSLKGIVDPLDYKTIASLSGDIFRGRYLKKKTAIVPKGELLSFLAEAYYGGRTEVFAPRVKNAYLYDIISAYPAAMKMDMPVGEPVPYDCSKGLDGFHGFARVE